MYQFNVERASNYDIDVMFPCGNCCNTVDIQTHTPIFSILEKFITLKLIYNIFPIPILYAFRKLEFMLKTIAKECRCYWERYDSSMRALLKTNFEYFRRSFKNLSQMFSSNMFTGIAYKDSFYTILKHRKIKNIEKSSKFNNFLSEDNWKEQDNYC